MTMTQTIKIPADRRITFEVPKEVPMGETTIIIQFPVKEIPAKKRKMTEEEELELINRHADELNREAMDVFSYQVPLWDDEEK